MSEKTSLRKAWEVLLPYLLYYLVYNAAYLILAFVYQTTMQNFGGEYRQFMVTHAATVTGVMGGLCMLAGILPLLSMLKRELEARRESLCVAGSEADERAGKGGKVEEGLSESVNRKAKKEIGMTVLTVVLAFTVSLGFNALLTLTGFANSSQAYQKVADRQYGVAFAAGLVLYGVISPLAEEVVFRGVIYNRLCRLYNPVIGIVVSGLLFGIFHGNPVQAVYGACLGMLMAYLYERSGKFRIPFLFHAVANLTVYMTARFAGVQEILFTPVGCAALLVVSVVCVLAVYRGGRAGCA